MEKRYKVIFSSLVKERDYFKNRMSGLGVSETLSEEILKKAPVTMKRNLSLKDARVYAEALFQAGGKATIHVDEYRKDGGTNDTSPGILTLDNFIMCPQCGHKQLKTETCIKCGLTLGAMSE